MTSWQGRARPRGRGAGGGFGTLLEGLGDLVSLIQRMAEEGEGEGGGRREFTSPSGAHGVYGFSVRLGIGGTPTLERFGNVQVTSKGPVVSDIREPIVDVFDEGDEVLVVAEIPGVDESNIHVVELSGDMIALAAGGPKRKYQKDEILLPAAVDPATRRQTYHNGYLELRFRKKTAEA